MKRKRSSETEFSVSSSAAAVPARRQTASNARTRTKVPVVPVETESEATVASTPVAQAIATNYTPSFDEVAALAYSFWEARGYQGGSPEEDWLAAEQQLRARTA